MKKLRNRNESTNFSNSSGINSPDNYSTVRDIALMSKYLIKNYPDFYKIYAEKTFTWDRTGGDPIKQGNRNPFCIKKLVLMESKLVILQLKNIL